MDEQLMVFSLVDGNYEVYARNDVRCHINFGEGLRARLTNVDQAWTKFKFDLDLGLAVIFVAPRQFRSNHELNSV